MIVGQFADSLARRFGRGLSEAENRELVRFVTTTDPAILRNALVDDGAMARIGSFLTRKVGQPLDRAAADTARGIGITQGSMMGAQPVMGLLGGSGR